MFETVMLVAAGVLSPVSLILALWVVFTILEIRDSSRATYKAKSVVRFTDSEPLLKDSLLKVEKRRGGYLVRFIEYDDNLEEITVHAVTLEKVDSPESD